MEHSQKIKLSFIVPIYNVKPYLQKCVDSLLHQDYEGYEIILVDDGSTDGSGLLADQLASSPHRPSPTIRVIHRENGGLSAARNSGIEIAQGEYICFVDSDDYWEENVLGGLMAQIERDDLDVLRFNYRNVSESGEEIHPNKNPKKYNDYSETITDGEYFLNTRLGYACYAWQFVMKRSLILNDNANCLFTEGILFEDTDWTPRMLLNSKRVASTTLMVYNYLWRVGSITLAVTAEKKRRILEDKIKLLQGFRRQRQLYADDSWFQWQIAVGTLSILSIITKDFYFDRVAYIQQVKDIGVFPLAGYRSTIGARLKILIANISPILYCVVQKKINK